MISREAPSGQAKWDETPFPNSSQNVAVSLVLHTYISPQIVSLTTAADCEEERTPDWAFSVSDLSS